MSGRTTGTSFPDRKEKMKRYYIAPQSVWLDHVDHFAGSSCIELGDNHLLICTDFSSEYSEDIWHSHPQVARLTHPQLEAIVPLADLFLQSHHAHKQFAQHHFDKLNAVLAISGLQPLDATHTLWDFHERIKGNHPGLKLNRY